MATDSNAAGSVETSVDGALVTVRLSGDIRLAHLQQVKERLSHHPDIADTSSLLVDVREARFDNLTSDDLRGFAAMPVVLSATARRAFVAPGPLSFALARMFEILRADESRTVQVFRDFEAARLWVLSDEPGEQEA